MKEYINSKSYSSNIFLFAIFTLLALLTLYLWKGGNPAAYTSFFLFLCLLFLSKKYTTKVLIDNSNMKIYYYKWGAINTLTFINKDLQAKADFITGRNGYKYKKVSIIAKNKIAYILTESDGFDNSDLDEIVNILEHKME